MKKILTYIIVITVSVVVGIGIGMFNLKRRLLKGDNIQSDTTTVIVYDTVRVKIPEPASARSVGIEVYPVVQVPVLLYHSDTITKPYFVDNDLVIPISQRYYKDERYQAWVSGYNPRLDSIVVYNTIQTISQIKGKYAENRLSIEARFLAAPDLFLPSIGARYTRGGLFAEVGGMYRNGIKPYLQVGYSVTLFR